MKTHDEKSLPKWAQDRLKDERETSQSLRNAIEFGDGVEKALRNKINVLSLNCNALRKTSEEARILRAELDLVKSKLADRADFIADMVTRRVDVGLFRG